MTKVTTVVNGTAAPSDRGEDADHRRQLHRCGQADADAGEAATWTSAEAVDEHEQQEAVDLAEPGGEHHRGGQRPAATSG